MRVTENEWFDVLSTLTPCQLPHAAHGEKQAADGRETEKCQHPATGPAEAEVTSRLLQNIRLRHYAALVAGLLTSFFA